MFTRLALQTEDLHRQDEGEAILELTEGMDYDEIVAMVAGVLQEMLTDGTALDEILASFDEVRDALSLDARDIRRKFH